MEIALVVAAVVGALILRRVALVRGFAQRRGAYAALYFVPQFVAVAVVIVGGIRLAGSTPALGALLVIAGAAYGLLLAQFVWRFAAAVSSNLPADDRLDRAFDAAAEFAGGAMGLVVVAAVIALACLVVWTALAGRS
jgi:hypothetical protein